MLLQAFAHAFVSVTIAELGTSATTSNRSHAFSIDSRIERQELDSISGSLLEHQCRSQNAVDWRVLKLVKTSLQLYLDCKKSKVSPSSHSSFYSKIKIYKRKNDNNNNKNKQLDVFYTAIWVVFCSLKSSVKSIEIT